MKTRLSLLALLLAFAGAALAESPPPFVFEPGVTSVRATESGWLAMTGNGHTITWRRDGDGWLRSAGASGFTRYSSTIAGGWRTGSGTNAAAWRRSISGYSGASRSMYDSNHVAVSDPAGTRNYRSASNWWVRSN